MGYGHGLLAILWGLYCGAHSVFAAVPVKRKLQAGNPHIKKNYRFYYTLFAALSLAGVVGYQLQLATRYLFSQHLFSLAGGILLGGSGLLLMGICIRKYFLRLSGIKSLIAEEEVGNQLRIDGVHRYVRHPLYLGTFLAIWGGWLLFPLLSVLLSNTIITVYTLIGIGLEEKKLVREFGQDYIDYRQRVPKLIPFTQP